MPQSRTKETTANTNGGEPEVAASPPPARLDLRTLLPAVATLTLLLLAICLRLYTAASLGPLWRDEWSSVDVATQPTLGAMALRMQWDSYPIAYFLVLRPWIALCGQSLTSLRILGVILSLLTLGALFRHARALGYRYPLLTLLLVGVCGNIVYWGQTNRAWQLGLLTLVLFYTAITQCLERPTLGRTVAAALIGVVAAQTLYYNALLIGVACAAGVIDCLVRGRRNAIPAILAAGVVPALSYLPYIGHFQRVAAWNMMLKRPDVDLRWIASHLWQTMAAPMPIFALLYIAAFGLTVAVGVWGIAAARRKEAADSAVAAFSGRDDFRFHVLCALLAVPLYLVFLVKLRYPTEPWYYLSLLTFVALAAESTLLPVLQAEQVRQRGLPIVAGLAALFSLASLGPLLPFCGRRLTSLDLTAATLARTAKPNDLILLNQWEAAIPWERFYHGAASWMTIPPVAEHHGHRWDLLKAQLEDPQGAFPPVRAAMERCIAQKGTVYMVGINSWGPTPPDVPLPSPPPLPDTGWDPGPYAYAWKIQAVHYLLDHGYVDSGRSNPPPPGSTTGFEDDSVDPFVPADQAPATAP